jgi:hypothetical protein
LDQQQGVADSAVDPVAQGEADVAVSAFLGEPVRCTGRVGADQQLFDSHGGVVAGLMSLLPVGGELLDGSGQHDDMVSRAVGSRVARPEHPGEHLAGLGQHPQQRVVPVGALMGRCSVFLVGLGAHDRGVEVQDRPVTVGAGAGLPRRGASVPAGAGQSAQLGRPQRPEGPLRAGARRHWPEQLRLTSKGFQVGEALGPIGQRHHHLRQAHARVVATPRRIREHLAEPGGQAAAIGGLAQPYQSATRYEAVAVAGHGPWPDEPGSFRPPELGHRMFAGHSHSPRSGGLFANPSTSATGNPG